MLAAEAEPVDVAFEVDDRQHLAQALEQVLRPGGAGRLVVDPVVGDVGLGIAGGPRLQAAQPLLARVLLVLPSGAWRRP